MTRARRSCACAAASFGAEGRPASATTLLPAVLLFLTLPRTLAVAYRYTSPVKPREAERAPRQLACPTDAYQPPFATPCLARSAPMAFEIPVHLKKEPSSAPPANASAAAATSSSAGPAASGSASEHIRSLLAPLLAEDWPALTPSAVGAHRQRLELDAQATKVRSSLFLSLAPLRVAQRGSRQSS
jgi:hypothetical protein